MGSIHDFMGKDHDRLDGIFKDLRESKDIGAKTHLFHDFKIGLQRHIVWEEEILFPTFEQKTGMSDDGPTSVMKMEHRRIKDFLERMHDKIAADDITGMDELENGLLQILSEHNNKEENILYPSIDSSADEKEKGDMLAKMESLPAEKYNKCCE